jgi:cutinase
MKIQTFTLIGLALVATASPLDRRQEGKPAAAEPKAANAWSWLWGSRGKSGSGKTGSAKSGSGSALSGMFGGSRSSNAPSSGSSSGGLASLLGSNNPLANIMGSSQSEIKPGNFQCKKAALIFARGTGEPGNLGYVVGPPLASSLKKALNGDILIQGADYTTNFMGGGATEMVALFKQLNAKCPQTKIIFGGYSQGAMQVHQALSQLGGEASKVAVSTARS